MQVDFTMSVSDLLNMFRKAKILDEERLTLQELLDVVEKFHTSGDGSKLSEKLNCNNFKSYLKAQPDLLKINKDIAARRDYLAKCAEAEKEGQEVSEIPVVDEIPDEVRREREESETAALRHSWEQEVISQHLMFVKGAEIIFQEFKEIIVELASRLKEKVDPKTGKFLVVLKKFVEEWLLRRLAAFVKFNIPAIAPAGKEATRTWPQSEKDALIREKTRQIEMAREAERTHRED